MSCNVAFYFLYFFSYFDKDKGYYAIFFIEEVVFDLLRNEKVMSKQLNMLKNLFTRDQILSYYLEGFSSGGVVYAGGLFSAIAIIDNDSITNKFLDNWENWSKNPRFHEFVSNLKDKDVDPAIEIKLKKLIKKSLEKLNVIVSRDAGTPLNFSNENQYLERLIDFFMDALK